MFSPVPVAAFGPGPVVLEPIVLTSVDRDQLLADTKAFAGTESAPGIVRHIDGVQRVVNNLTVANVANPEGFEAPESR